MQVLGWSALCCSSISLLSSHTYEWNSLNDWEMKQVCDSLKTRQWECFKLKLPLLPKWAPVISLSQKEAPLLPEIANLRFSTSKLPKNLAFSSNLLSESGLRRTPPQDVQYREQSDSCRLDNAALYDDLLGRILNLSQSSAAVMQLALLSHSWWIFNHTTYS